VKNIILQHWQGPMNELVEKSTESMKAYAESIGADYEFIRGVVFMPRIAHKLDPPCQKLIYLDEKYDDYDYVVMVDADMFVRADCTANIFTDDTGIGRHTAIQTALRQNLVGLYPDLGSIDAPYWGGSVFRLSRDLRQTLRGALTEDIVMAFARRYHDEGVMHALANKVGMKHTDENVYLQGQLWNYSSFEPDVHFANFIHIRTKITSQGPKREKIENYRDLVKRGLIK
jgi:hypothetical protein